MSRFSLASIVGNALSGNKNWKPQWPNAEPKAEYDVIIVGAGGHGLGAAYYLAKEHGITNVAVIEKAGLAAAIRGATPPLSAPTISMMRARISTNMR